MSERLTAAEQDRLHDDQFAFPEQRKEPLVDATHVRNAIARFDQVQGVTDAQRDQAWERIVAAAKKFGVQVSEQSWRDLRHGGEPAGKS
jgi:Myb/SANT-like DNA-binding domain